MSKAELQYQKNDELIRSEQNLDGVYLLHTNLAAAQCVKEQVLGNYKNLLAVEDVFKRFGPVSDSRRVCGAGGLPKNCSWLRHNESLKPGFDSVLCRGFRCVIRPESDLCLSQPGQGAVITAEGLSISPVVAGNKGDSGSFS